MNGALIMQLVGGNALTTFAGMPQTEKKSTKYSWVLGGSVIILLFLSYLFLMQQQSRTSHAIVAKAASSFDKMSSYHIKIKMTCQSNMQTDIAYSEYWYQSPGSRKMVLTQPGSTMVDVVDNGVRYLYTEGSGIAIESPVSAKELEITMRSLSPADSPKAILDRWGKGYRYTGTGKVGDRECEVIDGDFPEGRHVKICIDRATGVDLQRVETRQGKVVSREEVVVLDVNKPLPKDTFALKFPPKTLLIKAPEITPGLSGLDQKTVNATPGDGSMEHPYEQSSLQRIVDQGEVNRARLKWVYEPGYIPQGYKMVYAGGFDEPRPMADGTTSYNHLSGYGTIYVDYVNPSTGNLISLMESAGKPVEGEGRDVSYDGFHGRMATYDKPFRYVRLTWESGDVHLLLSASSLSDQEAIKIAKSLRPISVVTHETPAQQETRPHSIGGKLELRYLRSVQTEKHPKAKYVMNMTTSNDGQTTYQFIDSTGKTVDAKQIIDESPILLIGADLLPVSKCSMNPGINTPTISIQFNPQGTKKFADFTKSHEGEYLAIILDGRMLSAPRISQAILNGQAMISGGFKSIEEAQHLTDVLNGN